MLKKDSKIIFNGVEGKKLYKGSELLWEKVFAPGPNNLTGGNLEAGFYGEVPVAEFITGDELIRMLGVKGGVSMNSNAGWLKFSYKNNVIFKSKKPLMHSISFNQLNSFNVVYGNKTIEIGDNKYKVRLMRGLNENYDISGTNNPFNSEGNHYSEWNKLMLPIHSKSPSSWQYPNNVSGDVENWGVNYTDNDLGVYEFSQWCQDSSVSGHLRRGQWCVSMSNWSENSTVGKTIAWSPVLELV